jgi:hypothetical protein
MKTLINSVLKSSLVAVILSASLFSLNASAATVNFDKANPENEIKKVVVTGNTNVLLVQSHSQSVKMDDQDMSKVSLKQIGHTLTLSSNESQPVTVIVYVNDIYRIDASDKAIVNTAGKFNVTDLQIMLKDNAKARVKTNTKSIYTVVNDNANLKLIGTTENHISQTNELARVDVNKFAASKTQMLGSTAATAAVVTVKHKSLTK